MVRHSDYVCSRLQSADAIRQPGAGALPVYFHLVCPAVTVSVQSQLANIGSPTGRAAFSMSTLATHARTGRPTIHTRGYFAIWVV